MGTWVTIFLVPFIYISLDKTYCIKNFLFRVPFIGFFSKLSSNTIPNLKNLVHKILNNCWCTSHQHLPIFSLVFVVFGAHVTSAFPHFSSFNFLLLSLVLMLPTILQNSFSEFYFSVSLIFCFFYIFLHKLLYIFPCPHKFLYFFILTFFRHFFMFILMSLTSPNFMFKLHS